MAEPSKYIDEAFTATGAGTSTLKLRSVQRGKPAFIDLLVSGTFVGTVTLQQARPDSTDFVDVPNTTFTAPKSGLVEVGSDGDFRWNCTWTSGTVLASAVAP